MTRGADTVQSGEGVAFATPQGRWILAAAVLGSALAALDATVVNVALPAIGTDLGAALSGLQWILNGYLLALSALILLGGSLGDHFGRRRVFIVGIVWFTAASLLCGVAPNVPTLVAARVLQGVGGALLTPASLAIIQASFRPRDRARAIGAWSALGGVSAAVGPFLGGWMTESVTWRLVFLINLPLAAAVLFVAVRHLPESVDPTAPRALDTTGAALGAVGLAGVTYALIEAPEASSSPTIAVAAAIGIAALAAFVVIERRGSHPMLPLDIFSSRQFTAANLVTLVVYAALGGVFFLLVVQLQQVVGYSAVQAGVATLPVTVLMLVLSARAGQLAARIGPRLPMALGPLVIAGGLALMTRIGAGASYPTEVLPAVILFGLGLSLTVAPLTATVLAAADSRHAGIASGVNNAVARVAGLLAVSALPIVAGLSGDDYRRPAAFSAGFHRAMLYAAGLTALGGAIAWMTIRNDVLAGDGRAAVGPERRHHCAVDGPPLQPREREAVAG
jgi:EmrB/QacA subfamily drug resistance transporter